MSIKRVGTVIVALLMGTAVHAQRPGTTAAQEKPAAAQEKPPSAQAKPPSEVAGQPVNVKIDVTIVDQLGGREPARKTVTLIAADGAPGSIRSSGNNVRAYLNVDATPRILSNGNIRVALGLDYNPRQTEKGEPDLGPGGSTLTQRVAIVLVPGKSMVLSQAADPISERKITVEVKAEILK
jgi:hypothetical protein